MNWLHHGFLFYYFLREEFAQGEWRVLLLTHSFPEALVSVTFHSVRNLVSNLEDLLILNLVHKLLSGFCLEKEE